MKLWAELFERLEHLKVGDWRCDMVGLQIDWMLGSTDIALQGTETWTHGVHRKSWKLSEIIRNYAPKRVSIC